MAHLHTAPAGLISRGESLRKYFLNVFAFMAGGLTLTGAIAVWISHDLALMSSMFHLYQAVDDDGKNVTRFAASGWWWIAAIAQFGLVLLLSSGRALRMGKSVGYGAFALYAVLNGVTLAPALYAYTDASVAEVFFITAGTFGLCALWGHTTKRDLTKMGTFFMMALIGMLIALIVNLFFSSPMMDFVISIAGVLLFAGLTAFDMQKLEQYYDELGGGDDLVIYGALTLYLDFLNMFLFLLRLFGAKKD